MTMNNGYFIKINLRINRDLEYYENYKITFYPEQSYDEIEKIKEQIEQYIDKPNLTGIRFCKENDKIKIIVLNTDKIFEHKILDFKCKKIDAHFTDLERRFIEQNK